MGCDRRERLCGEERRGRRGITVVGEGTTFEGKERGELVMMVLLW